MIGRITRVRKRDGRLVDFDERKIADAIFKAACAVGREDRFLCEELAGVVTLFLEKRYSGTVPGIEEIQDMVEKVLIETGHARMAKAYILYRERRARAREQVEVRIEGAAGPLVGNPAKARVSPWQKARIKEALVREADLDERVAGDVAAAVEAKIFRRNVGRITTSVIRSLVEAELFERGFPDRVGRQALVGLPRYDVDRILRGGKGWRPAGPADLKRTVAEAVLAQYALSEIYGTDVVDAHLDRRLHLLDVGSPFEWIAATAPVPAAADAESWIDAVASLAARLGGVVTREVALTGLVPARCAFGGQAIAAARRLLGHSAFRALDPRGGRLQLCFAFDLMPPGEEAAALAEALVREHWARFRGGLVGGLPQLVVHVARDRCDGDAGRRVLLPALAAAAETGRLHFAFDAADAGSTAALVTPWYRAPAPEAWAGALPVCGAVAINVAALRGDGEEALLEALDEALVLAVKALKSKRSFMAALREDPSGPLYRVAAGARPLVAGAKGLDLVHLVGVREAARAVVEEPAAVTRLAGRLRSYAAVRLAEEGRSVRLKVFSARDRDGDAAARFFPEEGRDLDLEPHPLDSGIAFEGAEALLEPVGGTLLVRFERERAPAPEALFDAFCVLAADPRLQAIRLVPWPDRSVQAQRADL